MRQLCEDGCVTRALLCTAEQLFLLDTPVPNGSGCLLRILNKDGPGLHGFRATGLAQPLLRQALQEHLLQMERQRLAIGWGYSLRDVHMLDKGHCTMN